MHSTIRNAINTFVALVLTMILALAASADSSYKFDVIAQTGQAGLTTIGNGVSINDAGRVAFMGTSAGSDGIFVGDEPGSFVNITPGFGSQFNRRFDPAVQINNRNQVVTTHRVVTTPILTFVSIWNADSTDSRIPVASAGDSRDTYNTILSRPSIDNSVNHNVVFGAVRGTSTILVTPSFNELPIANTNAIVRPMMSDFGRFVVRAGNAANSPIRLYTNNLSQGQDIASSAQFAAMGRSPGITHDSRIVAFYGDLTPSGARDINAYQTTLTTSNGSPLKLVPLTPGPGVFVSININSIDSVGGRIIQRIAGVAGNGYLDPGETWDDANLNGAVDRGEDVGPIATFSTSNADSRVGVSSCGENSTSAAIVFSASDTDGKLGLYVNSEFLPGPDGDTFTSGSPGAVLSQGDTVSGLGGVIQDLVTYDPINSHGELAFWVSTSAGIQAVVRVSAPFEAKNLLSLSEVNRWFNSSLVRGNGAPVRVWQGNDVKELIDGEETFKAMVDAIRTATKPGHYIYLLNWWVTEDFPLVKGDPSTTLRSLLSTASIGNIDIGGDVKGGVEIRAMLWNSPIDPSQNESAVDFINNLRTGAAIWDSRTLLAGSHHQKILLVNGSEGLIAFCGGIDINPNRLNQVESYDPQHDVHCRIQGPAAGDLLLTFTQRWFDHPYVRRGLPSSKGTLLGSRAPLYPPPINGQTKFVQIGRTYGNGSRHAGIGGFLPFTKGYTFAPNGEQTSRQMFLHAIAQARKLIYIEDQYLVNLEARNALIAALQKNLCLQIIIVIPHSSLGALKKELGFQANYRRQQFIAPLRAVDSNRVHVFYLNQPPGEPTPSGYHTYVHSKTWIFDDEFAIIGSANTNRRGWTHDSEVIAGICDQGDGQNPRLAHQLRMRLWAEHLGLVGLDSVPPLSPSVMAQLEDDVKSARLWLDGKRPPGARIAPYDENKDIESFPLDNLLWNNLFDPDGS